MPEIATVSRLPRQGMITLKADLAAPGTAAALGAATGGAVPGQRRILAAGPARIAWMAPDELLLIVPQDEVRQTLERLREGLAGHYHLAADVSDARALFRIEGPGAREVLAKLCPVDLAPGAFGEGELRRTRLAQIPAAFWMEDEGFTLICFRSVAEYAADVLSGAAGAPVGLFMARAAG